MSEFFEMALLPDEVKLDLCLDLLEEFGVPRAQAKVRRHKAEIEHRCVMPWHEDKGPSAGLNYQKLVYSCFSCGASGGLLWLIGTCREGTTQDAREWLEKQTGTGAEASLSDVLRLLDAIAADRPAQVAPIPNYSPVVLRPWALIHPYLTEVRGIPEETVEELRLGYAEQFPIRKEDEHGRSQTRHSERIIIPHFWRDELVGWQSRRLGDDGTPKYLSTPDFPRDQTVYRPPRGRTIVVVEAPLSAARHIHHQPMSALFGAAFTEAQIRVLADYERIVWWMDPDVAGWRATEGWTNETTGQWVPGGPELLSAYSTVLVPTADWAADPGELDDEAVDEAVATAESWALWERPSRLRCWRCKDYHGGPCHLPDPVEVLLAQM